MNVFILTEGGKDAGLGHITRCTSIYQAFEEVGIRPALIVNGDEAVQDLLKDKNFMLFDWLDDRERLFAAVRNADIVFIDSYLADCNLYEKISNIAGTGVYFDDKARVEYPKGFVLNGAIFAERMPCPKRNGVTYLLGAGYAPLRREFWDVPEKSIRDNLEIVMITFGGADIRNLTPKVLKLLTDTYPKLFKKVIIGKGFCNTAEIEELKDKNTELIYYPNAAEMKKIMLESDVAISAGGQTLYELARVGVPTIAVAVADNQLTNIYGWEQVGFAERAGASTDEELTGRIRQKIELLEDNKLRQCKSKVGRKVIDGAGCSRIVEEVLSGFYNDRLVLRKATQADAQHLFNLANEDTVRKNSFSSGKIDWEHHLGWLDQKLTDGNCLFLIVEHLGEFAGQVRFDVISTEAEAVISISLEKSIRGSGFSPFVINRSIEKLLDTRRDVKFVKAHIIEGNITSIRAFKRAGFKFSKHTLINGRQSVVYERAVKDEPE